MDPGRPGAERPRAGSARPASPSLRTIESPTASLVVRNSTAAGTARPPRNRAIEPTPAKNSPIEAGATPPAIENSRIETGSPPATTDADRIRPEARAPQDDLPAEVGRGGQDVVQGLLVLLSARSHRRPAKGPARGPATPASAGPGRASAGSTREPRRRGGSSLIHHPDRDDHRRDHDPEHRREEPPPVEPRPTRRQQQVASEDRAERHGGVIRGKGPDPIGRSVRIMIASRARVRQYPTFPWFFSSPRIEVGTCENPRPHP